MPVEPDDQSPTEVHTTEVTEHPISEGPRPEAPPEHEVGMHIAGLNHGQMLASINATSFVLYRQTGESNAEPLVTVSLIDGTVTYAEDYVPDDAARAFWAAVEHMKP
jgi:hypothetical protein